MTPVPVLLLYTPELMLLTSVLSCVAVIDVYAADEYNVIDDYHVGVGGNGVGGSVRKSVREMNGDEDMGVVGADVDGGYSIALGVGKEGRMLKRSCR